MVDKSQAYSDSIENGPADSSRRYRDNIRRKLQRLRQLSDKKIQISNSALSSKSQRDLDEVGSKETEMEMEIETRDTRSITESKLDGSTINPILSRRKQKIVKTLLRSRSFQRNKASSALTSQQILTAVPSLSSDSRARLHASILTNVDANDDNVTHNHSLQGEASRKGHHEIPRPISNISSQPQKDGCNSRTSFHVRLSIGYMTGLKVETNAKRTKQPNNNRIIVGFVELASSGKYTALSQPLLTNVEEKAKTMKILWANQKGGEEISKSKSRRRLHFSLLLEKEGNTFDARDDHDNDSLCSQGTYVPEVVKLLFGLKCGDERIPLGIAKFVINGRETVEQKMDLDVHPTTRLAAGSKKKRGIFGKKQRNSFTLGDLTYCLAQNATLRIKADIKVGYPGQDGAEIWGNEEASYTTKWTFDAGRAVPPHIKKETQKVAIRKSATRIPVNEGDTDTPSPINIKETTQIIDKIDHSLDTDLYISLSRRQERVIHQAPAEYVTLDASNDMMSLMSGMTNTECDKSWSCAPFCCGEEFGHSNDRYRGLLSESFSFDSS